MGGRYRPGNGFGLIFVDIGLVLQLALGFIDRARDSGRSTDIAWQLAAIIAFAIVAGGTVYKLVKKRVGEARVNEIDREIFYPAILGLLIYGAVICKRY